MNEMLLVDIDDIQPADYNPRHLSDEAFEMLRESLNELGQLKPVIYRKDNNVILAGHQRTRALKSLGIDKCLAIGVTLNSENTEVRFNQFHNMTEFAVYDGDPKIKFRLSDNSEGVHVVQAADVDIVETCKGGADFLKELCVMLNRYGNFGMPICDKNGDCHISALYAMASKLTNTPLHVLVASDDVIRRARFYLAKEYGEFSYDHIQRTTWMQCLAQMHRYTKHSLTKRAENTSVLYEKVVLPKLSNMPNNGKDLRILDFGSGEFGAVNKLMSLGYDIRGVEPYYRTGTKIDYAKNAKRYEIVASEVKKDGLYDIVICDSVLNSVDTLQAYNDVINCCIALTKMGGLIFYSGRIKESQHARMSMSKNKTLYFMDSDGFSGNARNNVFFFQKFCTKEQIECVAKKIGPFSVYYNSNSYKVTAKKEHDISDEEALASLAREWDMPLPGGKSYGLSSLICDAYKNAKKNE